jgi:hypothetical protein
MGGWKEMVSCSVCSFFSWEKGMSNEVIGNDDNDGKREYTWERRKNGGE